MAENSTPPALTPVPTTPPPTPPPTPPTGEVHLDADAAAKALERVRELEDAAGGYHRPAPSTVAFIFGDVSGWVERDLYESFRAFHRRYLAEREPGAAADLNTILREMSSDVANALDIAARADEIATSAPDDLPGGGAIPTGA